MLILYINDIPKIYDIAKFILYADDANIIITGSNFAEINEQLNVLCGKLVEWVATNGLALNIKKKEKVYNVF